MSAWGSGRWAGAAAGEAVLAATITGGDDSQSDLATVACEVVVTDATGAETYAWTLTDPRGVSRTALLDDATIADPVFTPDNVGGGGQWVARVTVTRGSASLVLSKIITIGQSGFVLARSIVSDGTTDASVSGGNITWGGVTFAAPNTGVAVVDGDLVLTGQASTDLGRSSTSARTAALVAVSLNTLAGITSTANRQVLIVLDVESYTPSGFNEGLRVGAENSTNPIGSGASGFGIASGQAFVTSTIRTASTIYQSSGSTATTQTGGTAAIAGVAILCANAGIRTFTKASAYADAASVLADTVKHEGGLSAAASPVDLNQVVIAAVRPVSGVGAACTIRGLQAWVR